MSCLVDGAKPLTTFWQKNGITLDLKKLPHLTQLPDGPLMITDAEKKRDQGRYRCIVSNSVGKVISREAEVIFPCKCLVISFMKPGWQQKLQRNVAFVSELWIQKIPRFSFKFASLERL